MEYRKQAHAFYYTRYHIVLSTKYRHKVLKKGVGDYLEKLVRQITNFHPDIEILEINRNEDHIHMMVIIPPKYTMILPDNSIVYRLPRFLFPYHRCFTLIGYTDGCYVIRSCIRLPKDLSCNINLSIPDGNGIVLHPPGVRVHLLELLLR
jgi:hypothetical protein